MTTITNHCDPHYQRGGDFLADDDIQLIAEQAFVFTDNGIPVGAPARTLKEFSLSLQKAPLRVLDGDARRRDFSRSMTRVFHDLLLASAVRKVELRYRLGHAEDLYNSLVQAL